VIVPVAAVAETSAGSLTLVTVSLVETLALADVTLVRPAIVVLLDPSEIAVEPIVTDVLTSLALVIVVLASLSFVIVVFAISSFTMVASTIDALVTEFDGITFCVNVSKLQLTPLYTHVLPADVKVALVAGELGKSIAIYFKLYLKY
jgi:hypothetical protein